MDKYVLDDEGNVVPCEDLQEWGKFMQAGRRKVARLELGDWTVSTVFLGLNHNCTGEGEPQLYETMIFLDGTEASEKLDETCWRAATRDDAMEYHRIAVRHVGECWREGKVA